MLVQYLVALCCLHWEESAVDVTIGDMVLDPAAGKKRDVDVTVTVSDNGHPKCAIKAYEVKHESKPLDVAIVEGLCVKLKDMPSLSHRAIASTSGFTDGAKSKAKHHGIKLLHMKQWDGLLEKEFPALGMRGTIDERFRGTTALLFWISARFDLDIGGDSGGLVVNSGDKLFGGDGSPHKRFSSFEEYRSELQLRSTQILYRLEPAATILRTYPMFASDLESSSYSVSPPWSHTHTIDVAADDIHFLFRGKKRQLKNVTISGQLQWQPGTPPERYVFEDLSDGSAFAGALLSVEPGEGRMTALVFSPKTSAIAVRFVRLSSEHLNAIRRLKLDLEAL